MGPNTCHKWKKRHYFIYKDVNKIITNGVSINQITFTKHDELILTDACEAGLGGYNPRTGKGWRFRFHINILEFIASLIGVWLEIRDKKMTYLNILAKTDISSAIG